jgi:hypothetical protein
VGYLNILSQQAIIVAPKDQRMSQHITTGKRKCVTLMLLQKLEIIRWFESSKSQKGYGFIQSFMAPSRKCEGPLKQQTLNNPKLVQLGKVLYKLFTVMHSKAKPVTGPTTAKAMSFYGEMKITDKYTISECTHKKIHTS